MKSLGHFSKTLVFLACLAVASPAVAEVYKWVDENGVVHYTDRPPERERPSTEIDIPSTPGPRPPGGVTDEPQNGLPWYEQWLAEQRQRRLTEKQARAEAHARKGGEQAQMLETCVQARQRLTILETPCRVFFDGRGVLRNWCAHQTTYAYPGEFRFLDDDERANMLRHYRERVDECEAAGY